MRSLRLLVLAALGLACSSSGGSVQLAPTIVFPAGLLDTVTELKISVYDTSGGLDCNATDGTVTGLSGQAPLATKDLGSSNCASGAKFCGDIPLDKSDTPRLFAAQAFVGSGTAPVASGCTKATPNQDTLQVKITMLRTLPPSMCNGKQVPGLTQCATGDASDPVCDQNCQSLEEYFSKGDGTTTSDAKPKIRPQLVWPAASGDAGRLLAFWGDKSQASGNEVAMRVLDDHMEPYAGQGAFIQTNSFRMPGIPNAGVPGSGYALPQFNPTAATINGSYYVAFEDTSGGPTAIKMRSMDSILNPQQANAVQISDSTGGQVLPSMAANGNNLFVAWENSGTIVGKMVDSSLAPGTQQSLGAGTTVTVAATATGWVAVWQNGADIEMSKIDATGKPGAAQKVNDAAGAAHPGVAAFGNNVAVIWVDGSGNVIVQRFDASGNPIAGDQTNFLQDPTLGGNQSSPSIAAGANFFIATWVDAGAHVRARFLDGAGGYLYNAVNGQSIDFQVSKTDGETVTSPVAAVGGSDGSSPFVCIAWEVDAGSPTFNGIYGRRFPLPQQ
jgi:hypothetical protein